MRPTTPSPRRFSIAVPTTLPSTPPQSPHASNAPTSPPPPAPTSTVSEPTQVAVILRTLVALRRGDAQAPDRTSFDLSPHNYTRLQELLSRTPELKAWVDDKLRYNYSGEEQLLVLRMPDARHDLFAHILEGRLAGKLRKLIPADDPPLPSDQESDPSVESESSVADEDPREPPSRLQYLVKSIRAAGTSSDPIGGKNKKSPDAQFYFDHPTSKHPTLVVEVANSETKGAVKHSAYT